MKADHEQHILADCIEKFLSTYDLNGESFKYKKINLKYAIERELYVKCVSDSSFMKSFRDVVVLDKDCNAFYSDPSMDAFISFLKGYDVSSIRLKFLSRWAVIFRKKLIATLMLIKSRFNFFLNKILENSYSSSCNLIIFASIDRKHSIYINPIIENIGATKCLFVPLRKGNKYWKQGLDLKCGFEYPVFRVCLDSGINLKITHPLYSQVAQAAVYVDSYFNLIEKCRPKSIVFTEAASYEEDIFSRVALHFGVPTVRVQYGRAGILHNGYRNMAYSKMLMWGEGFSERLERFSPAPSYIVTGPHILDLESKEVDEDERRIRKFTGNRKLLTIVTQPMCATISEEDYKLLIRCVNHVLISRNDYFVVVRKHPADLSDYFLDLEKLYPNNFLITNSEELHILSVLRSSSYIIGFYSTMLSEAVAVGVLPIVLPLTNSNEIFPAPENEGAAIKIMNTDELENEIDYALSDDVMKLFSDGMNEFSKKYFYKMDGMSAQRICDEITRM